MSQVKWSPSASRDLDGIHEYISRDSLKYAQLTVRRIIEMVDELPIFPRAGRIVPEIQNRNIRERIYKSYRIVYRINIDAIEVLNIFHTSMDIFSRIESIRKQSQ